jgi:hypothetical protein
MINLAEQKNAPDRNSRGVCINWGEHFNSTTAAGLPDAVAAGDLIDGADASRRAIGPCG